MADEDKLSKKERAFLEAKNQGNDAVSAGQVELKLIDFFVLPTRMIIFRAVVRSCRILQRSTFICTIPLFSSRWPGGGCIE